MRSVFITLVSMAACGLVSAQNVGIGTNTPLERLHVAGNVRVNTLAGVGTRLTGADANGTLVVVAAGTNGQLLTQTAGGPAWQNNTNWSLTGNAGTSAAANFLGTSDNVDFVIRTNNNEQVRITNGGNVGIGTNGPAAKLHVIGDVRVGPINPTNTGALPGFGNAIYFSGGPAGATFNSDNSDPIWMARYNASSDGTELRLNLSDNCSTIDAFVIQTGGSGCAVTDFFRFDGSGAAYKPGGGSWAAISDARLKHSVANFQDGMNVLSQLRPVTYQYNGLAGTPNDGQEYIGFVAQEVQPVAPYMVRPYGDYLTVDPSALNYILINALKEQQAEIDTLKQQNTQMQSQFDWLKAEVEGLKTNVK